MRAVQDGAGAWRSSTGTEARLAAEAAEADGSKGGRGSPFRHRRCSTELILVSPQQRAARAFPGQIEGWTSAAARRRQPVRSAMRAGSFERRLRGMVAEVREYLHRFEAAASRRHMACGRTHLLAPGTVTTIADCIWSCRAMTGAG